jgi:hypothetical protein
MFLAARKFVAQSMHRTERLPATVFAAFVGSKHSRDSPL